MTDAAASTLARKRWARTSKKDRQSIARDISNTRWAKWRAANPDKAKASEARRKQRSSTLNEGKI